MEYNLTNGKKYKAKITLGVFQRLGSNEDVKAKLVQAGFTGVTVTGEGKYREAEGTWGGSTQLAPVPKEVSEIVEQ